MSVGEEAASLIGYLGRATSLGREIHGRLGAIIQDIIHLTATGPNDLLRGDDISCGELLVLGHPDNTGAVWVRTGEDATTSTAWPLEAGEVFSFNVSNLSELSVLVVVSGEKLIIAYA